MNAQETLALIQALRSAGVTRFKSLEHDIHLGPPQSHELLYPTPSVSVSAQAQPPVPVEEDKEATEKLKGLIETLKMDDATLFDTIFPAGAGG